MSADRKAKERAAKLCLQLLQDQLIGLAGKLTGSEGEYEFVYADYRMPCGGEVSVQASVRFRAGEKPARPAPKAEPKKLGAERRLLLKGPKP